MITELLIVVLALLATGLMLALVGVCCMAFWMLRDFARMHMATDWPSYAGLLMRQEKMMAPWGYRARTPQDQSIPTAPEQIFQPDPVGSKPEEEAETVAKFG